MERYLTDLFISKGIVKEDDREIYEYGLKVGAMYVIDFIVAFIIAIILNEIVTFIISLIIIGMLRRNAGGFHAKSASMCFVLSEIYIIGCIITVKLLQNSSMLFIDGIFVFSFVFLVETIMVRGIVLSKHIDEENVGKEHQKYTSRSYVRIGVIFIVAVFSFGLGLKKLICVIIYAYIGEGLLIRISSK